MLSSLRTRTALLGRDVPDNDHGSSHPKNPQLPEEFAHNNSVFRQPDTGKRMFEVISSARRFCSATVNHPALGGARLTGH